MKRQNDSGDDETIRVGHFHRINFEKLTGPPEPEPAADVDEIFPGVRTLSGWARRCGVNRSTIRRWVDRHDIRVKVPGDEAMIHEDDFWAGIPYAETSRRRRGPR